MIETCQNVITWLQTLTVASIMSNFLLLALVCGLLWELRKRDAIAADRPFVRTSRNR